MKYFFIFIASFLLLFQSCKQSQTLTPDWRMVLQSKNISNEQKLQALAQSVAYYCDTINGKEQEGLSALLEMQGILRTIPSESWKNWWKVERIKRASLFEGKKSENIGAVLNNYLEEATEKKEFGTAFQLLQAGSLYYLSNNNIDDAQRLINKIQTLPDIDESNKIQILLLLGDLSYLQKLPIDQLNYLLEARNKSIISNSDSLLKICYEKLSDFYFFQNKYNQALRFANLKNEVILGKKNIDSFDLYYNQILTAIIDNKAGDWGNALTRALQVDLFAVRKGYTNLGLMAESEIRSVYISKEDIDDLADYYKNIHPLKLEKIKTQDTVLYYRLMAYLLESDKKIDSAIFYFNKAIDILPTTTEEYQSNFYNRLAEFFKRHSDFTKVDENYRLAYNAAEKSQNLNMSITTGDSLLKYWKQPSLQFLDTLNLYKDRLILMQNNDAIRDMELNNVIKQKELEENQQHEEKSRQSNLQLQMLALIIALVFMTMVVISNFRVHKWWFKTMSYISLITLFELILYIVVYRLDFITNKEPMKVLGIKVAIIALLTPTHHWIEHSMVRFLTTHKVLSEFGEKIKFFVNKYIKSNLIKTKEAIKKPRLSKSKTKPKGDK